MNKERKPRTGFRGFSFEHLCSIHFKLGTGLLSGWLQCQQESIYYLFERLCSLLQSVVRRHINTVKLTDAHVFDLNVFRSKIQTFTTDKKQQQHLTNSSLLIEHIFVQFRLF